MACEILVPQPGIQPEPSVLAAWSRNPWTTREIPGELCIDFLLGSYCPESTSDKGELAEGWGGATEVVSNPETHQGGSSGVKWQVLFLKLIFIGVQLIYSVVLAFSVWQSELVTHIHISSLF